MAASGVAACVGADSTRADAGSDRCPRFLASVPAAPDKLVHSLRVEPATPYRAGVVVTIGPYERCDLALSAHIVPRAAGSANVTPTERRVAVPVGSSGHGRFEVDIRSRAVVRFGYEVWAEGRERPVLRTDVAADIDVARDGTVQVRGSQTRKPSPSG